MAVYRFLLIIVLSVMYASGMSAQTELVRECRQKSFPKSVPPGNYSGITHIGGNKYAVVSDKSATDGFFIFSIDIDSVTGGLLDVRCESFKGDSLRGGDCEGIAFRPESATLFVSREADASIVEYGLDGKLTGKELAVPSIYKDGSMGNYGFESLAYDTLSHVFWTISESTLNRDGERATSYNGVANRLRLLSFGDELNPVSQYAYLMDEPEARSKSSQYAMGVSELAILDTGRLLVLEREFFVPKKKLGAFVKCKLYEVEPNGEYAMPIGGTITDDAKFLPKRLVCSFTTKLKLLDRSIANYEGMCLGPDLADGNKVLILVSDSQDQYAGVLKDWFKTIVIKD